MTALTADQIAQDWANKLGGAQDKMKAGAMAVPIAPGQAAAQQKAVWAQNVVASQDKWARNVAAITKESWVNDYVVKGLPRVATGATAAIPKFTQFLNKLLPVIATGRAQLPARGSYSQNKARANAWMDYMHSKAGQLRP
jgi:hypothetical protein